MTKICWSLVSLSILFGIQMTDFASARDQCSDTLIQDQYSGSFSVEQDLALMRIVESESDFTKSRGAAASRSRFQDAWSGSYSDFQNKRSRYFSQYSYDESYQSSQRIVTSALSPQAINAWKTCMLNISSGVLVYFNDITEQTVGVTISWNAPPGAPNPGFGYASIGGARPSGPNANEIIKQSLGPSGWGHKGSVSFFFDRKAESDLRVVMNLGGYSEQAALPFARPVARVYACHEAPDSKSVSLPYLYGGRVPASFCGKSHHVDHTRPELYAAQCIKTLAVRRKPYVVAYDCGGTPGMDPSTDMFYERDGADVHIEIGMACEDVRRTTGRTDLTCG